MATYQMGNGKTSWAAYTRKMSRATRRTGVHLRIAGSNGFRKWVPFPH
ncbi:hypothetical protein [Spirosoma areae]